MPVLRPVLAALCLAATVAGTAAEPATETPPPWAYGFKTPPPSTPPKPAPAAAPIVPTPPPNPKRYGLPDTARTFTRAEITDIFNPADFYPEDHPPPPSVVAHGKPPAVWACARCHYANGKGRPENAGLAGLPVDYFVAQLQAFRRGERTSADPRKPNTQMMADYARGLSDDEIQTAAEYYGALRWTRWIRVVECDRVPRTEISAGMYLQSPDGGDEPLGDRIVEVPEDPAAVELARSPRVGFIAYVPVGSVQRGAALVTTGAAGRTVACATCHGPDLNGGLVVGFGSTPGIAGRSPSYLMRQLFDIRTGHRTGLRLLLMQPIVAQLTVGEMRDIVAYLASLPAPAPAVNTPAPTAP